MGPPVDPVEPSGTMPPATEIVVIGAGIIGVTTGLFLAQAGVPVVICEKGEVAGEQSSRNWGWVRRMGRDPRELPLIVEAIRLWEGMRELTGQDVGFRHSGILYLCENERDVAEQEAWLKSAGEYTLDTRLIRGEALRAVLPGAARDFPAALHTPSDGRAEPQVATPAMARAAMRAGATLLTGCAVRAVETSAGAVSGVLTERGPIRCRAVVIAGGAWSDLISRRLGLRLPQLVVRSSVQRTAPLAGGPETAAWAPRFAFRKRLDGGYTIADGTRNRHDIAPDSFRYLGDFMPLLKRQWRDVSLRFGGEFFRRLGDRAGRDGVSPFERRRILDPDPIAAHLDAPLAALGEAFPVFRDAAIVQRWAGLIDTTPDAVPVISAVPTIRGLVIATGFSGHGFGIGPGAGRLAADLVTGRKPLVDPSPFRHERFTDGSRAEPMSGL